MHLYSITVLCFRFHFSNLMLLVMTCNRKCASGGSCILKRACLGGGGGGEAPFFFLLNGDSLRGLD